MAGKGPRSANAGSFTKGDPRAGRPKGTLNKSTVEIRETARALVGDPAYVTALKARLKKGRAAPAVECLLFHYAYGKPKDTLTLEGSESLAELLQVALTGGHGGSAE